MNKDIKNKNQKDQFRHIQDLGSLTPKYCENCGNLYTEGDARIVHENQVAMVILFHCKGCSNSYLVNVIKPAGVASRVGINTDLGDYEEISKFIGKQINADDVINAHKFFDGIDSSKFFEELKKFDAKA